MFSNFQELISKSVVTIGMDKQQKVSDKRSEGHDISNMSTAVVNTALELRLTEYRM